LTIASRQALWQESISRGSPELVVAKENGEVIGFISFGACRDAGVPDSVAEIWALHVLPDQGSRGVGRRLWLHARERLLQLGYQSVSLWVFAENARAIDFYRTAGFVLDPVGTQETVLGGKSLLEVRYVCELT
jgi:ribosomal protein S18 acetylase RimI-like enzyme